MALSGGLGMAAISCVCPLLLCHPGPRSSPRWSVDVASVSQGSAHFPHGSSINGTPQRALVLVDRLWPRGVKRDDLALDEWAKDVAPTAELRR